MLIDCGQCAMREIACGDCVVSHFLGAQPMASDAQIDLVPAEQRALRVLHGAGLVPPIQMRATVDEAVAG